jgi:flagellar biosynthetic protein FliO
MTRFFRLNSWKIFWVLGLVLGFSVFQPFGLERAYALEPNSPLFDQNSKANSAPSSQPMALPEEIPNPSPGLFSTLVRLISALALTIILIAVTVWGLKWILEKRGWNNQTDEGKPLKILSSLYLAPRKTIYLVEVGKRILVLGVGSDEVNCLDVIQDAEELEALKNAFPQGFNGIFNRIVRRHETDQQEAETKQMIEESSQAVGDYVAKLKSIKNKKTPSETTGEK